MDRLGVPRFSKVINALGSFEFGRSGGYKAEHSTPLPTLLGNALKVADAYRVTHDMSMLVEHAAAGLDGLDQFGHSLAPSRCGFVAFDRPLPLPDQRGKVMLVHYLIWGPVSVPGQRGPATLMLAFNDIWRQPDDVQGEMLSQLVEVWKGEGYTEESIRERIEEHEQMMGRWATVGASVYFDEQRLGPHLQMPSEEAQSKILAEGDTPHPGMNGIRYLHALWLMMGQTIAKPEVEAADRPARRRAQKRALPGKVTVVKLRREKGDYERREGESEIEWAHRWVVKGHWRWQAVSAHHHLAQEIEPGKYRARIWINPYVKGPEDKPFHQTEKVYSLER